MSLSITHTDVVVIPDDGISAVGSNAWNAVHAISGTIDVSLLGGKIYGGSATNSNLTLQSTSNVSPSGDQITFVVGGVTVGFLTNVNWNIRDGAAVAEVALESATAGASDNPDLTFLNSRGSYGSPTKLLAGDTIGDIGAYAFNAGDGGSPPHTSQAVIAFVSQEDQNGTTNRGTYITVATTPAGSGTRQESARFFGNGELIMNNGGFSTVTDSFVIAYSVDSSNNPAFFQGLQQSNDAVGGYIQLVKSRGTTPGANGIVTNGDSVGAILFTANNGTGSRTGAGITSFVDAVPTSGQRVAQRIEFSTAFTNGSVTTKFLIDSKGNLVCNTGAISASATDGFLYLETCAGSPSGTPTSYTGRAPLIYDTTNNKLWAYNGAWKGVVLS